MDQELKPLSAVEERFWRAFMKAALVTRRTIDEDLVESTGLSLGEYGVLMNLSEAAHRSLRMSALATSVGLSRSHVSRMVGALARDGLIVRTRDESDARGLIVELTDEGLVRLSEAWEPHLRSARDRVMDHLDPSQLVPMAQAMERLTEHVDQAE